VCPFKGLIRVKYYPELRHRASRRLGRYRIIAYDARSQGAKGAGYLEAWSLPQVVGVGLEGEPQQRYTLAL